MPRGGIYTYFAACRLAAAAAHCERMAGNNRLEIESRQADSDMGYSTSREDA